MAGMIGSKMTFGAKVDRWATKLLTPLAARMAKSRRLGNLAISVSGLAGFAALGVGCKSWQMGSALDAAAKIEGFESYSKLVASNDNVWQAELNPQLKAAVKTEQTVTWWMFGFHLNAVTHMALNDLFPYSKPSVDSLVGALSYVGGAWGKAAVYAAIMTYVLIVNHESGHYAAGVKGKNIRPALLEPILEQMEKPFYKRIGWTVRNYLGRLLIPLGKFTGIARPNALDYELDGAAPLPVRAAGPKRDLILAIPALLISLGALGLLAQNVGESSLLIDVGRKVAEWLFPAGAATLYSAFRYDSGALIENFKVKRAEKKIIKEGRGREERVSFDTTQVKNQHQIGIYGEE